MNGIKGKIVSLALIMCLVAGMLSGCGKGPEATNGDVGDKKVVTNEEKNDLFSGEWKREEAEAADSFMVFSEYNQNVFERFSGEQWGKGYAADSRYIYNLEVYYEKNGQDTDQTYYVHKYDIETGEVISIPYEQEDIFTTQMLYVAGGRTFGNNAVYDEDGELTGFSAMEFLSDGTVCEFRNVIDVIEENGWKPEPHYAIEAKIYYEPKSEKSYVISEDEDRLVVVDKSGNKVEFNGFSSGNSRKVSYFASTEDGQLIFLCLEGKRETIFYFEENAPVVLFTGAEGSEAYATNITIDSNGRLLYVNDMKSVIRWDTVSGKQEILNREVIIGAFRTDYFTIAARNSAGELLMLSDNVLMVMTEDGPQKQVTITVEPLGIWSDQIKKALRRYEESHPGVTFEYLPETEWDQRESKIGQVLADLASGSGPDIMLMDEKTLEAYINNQCLMDISGVLKADISDKLINSAKETALEENYSVLFTPSLRTVYTSKKYCPKGSWTVADILDAIDAREAEGNPFERIVVSDYSYYEAKPFAAFLMGIEDTEFLDVEEGSCDFESELFIRLLNTCKTYTNKVNNNTQSNTSASLNMLKDDKALMYVSSYTTLYNYSEACATVGEDIVAAGFPVASGTGSKVVFERQMAFNRASMTEDPDKWEVIKDLINCVYLPDYLVDSIPTVIPMTVDFYDGRILLPSERDWLESPAIEIDAYSSAPIAGKPDGTSYVEEYIELLNSADRKTMNAGVLADVKTIITEETDIFFEGDRSAEETARIIQSRVSLCLEEQN